jgi:hypothetical protein
MPAPVAMLEESIPETGDFAMLRSRHVIAIVIVGTALSGCYPPPLSTPPVAEPTVTGMYDGTYRGSVELTYVAPLAQRAWCQTPEQVIVNISSGSLSYAQPHPTYPQSPVINYSATVTNDSKFTGASDMGGAVNGQITSTHLTGTLDGLGCSYTIDAERS